MEQTESKATDTKNPDEKPWTGKLLPDRLAARELGVSPGWLRKMRVSGGGPVYLKFGRSVRYAPESLASYKAERSRRSTAENDR